MEERPFGKIGVKFPILSFGAQRVVDGHGCSESQAVKILNHALDRGIRYFDTAWVYSGGQSEERVGRVARHRRKEMWIATKTITRTAKESRLQLEESLRRLQTDHIDDGGYTTSGLWRNWIKSTDPADLWKRPSGPERREWSAISVSVVIRILRFRSKP